MPDMTERGQFLSLAALFEGGLLALAVALGWLTGAGALESLTWEWKGLLWGVIGTVPLFLLFLLSHRFPAGPLLPIKQFLIEVLGPPLAACRWYDLILMALWVGFCEEAMFRGFLQPWLETWGGLFGLIGSNVVFGLIHCITPLYGVLAGLTGVYLGLLLDVAGDRNLLVPVVAHALYDYLAFLVVLRAYRSHLERRPKSAEMDEMETDDLLG